MSEPNHIAAARTVVEIAAARTVVDLIYEMRNRAEKAEAEADRLREALVRVGYSVAGAHPEAMRKIARVALDAENDQ